MPDRSQSWLCRKEKRRVTLPAEDAGFQVLLTVDEGLAYQQNLSGRRIALLIVRAQSNKLADLLPYVPACLEALRSIKPGELVRVVS